MPLTVNCASCKVRLTLGDEAAGTTLPCPRCGARIGVPKTKHAPPAAGNQFFVTHCAAADSVLNNPGYSVRAASTVDPDALDAAFRYPPYELPIDLWRERPAAAATPRRLGRTTHANGGVWVVHSSYLEKDTVDRDRSYFSHLVLVPSAGPADVLRSWGASGWATSYPPGATRALEKIATLPVGRLVTDAALSGFLGTGPTGPTDLSLTVGPERLRGRARAARRRDLLARVLQALLLNANEPNAERRRLYIHAEPGLVALLLYGAVRLLPPTVTDNLTFSTFEPYHRNIREYKSAEVVGTFLGAPDKGLDADLGTTRGLALDTYSADRSSPLLRGRLDGAVPTKVLESIDLAARGEWQKLQAVRNAFAADLVGLSPSGKPLAATRQNETDGSKLTEPPLRQPPGSAPLALSTTRTATAQSVAPAPSRVGPPARKRYRTKMLVLGAGVLVAAGAIAVTRSSPPRPDPVEVAKGDPAQPTRTPLPPARPGADSPEPETASTTRPPEPPKPVGSGKESIPKPPIALVMPAEGAAAAEKARREALIAELDACITASKKPDAAVRRKAVEGLVKFLGSADPELRGKAAQAIAGAGADAEPAVAALKTIAEADSDPERRKLAQQTLAQLEKIAIEVKKAETAKALADLVLALKKKEPEDRVRALNKIAAFGPDAKGVGSAVIEAMRDEVRAVQLAAAETFLKIDPKVQPYMVALVRATNPATSNATERREALAALGKLGAEAEIALPFLIACNDNINFWVGANTKEAKSYDNLLAIVAKIGPKDKRFAKCVLASVAAPNPAGDPALRERRVAALAHLNTIDAETGDKVKALATALEDGDATLEVVKALQRYGKGAAPALPALKRLKSSTDETIRDAVITAIVEIDS